MPKYVKLFPLQAMTFQKWPSWSCEIRNILFKGQSTVLLLIKKIFLVEIAQVYFSRYYFVCERREIFSRLNLCLAERERDWPWAKQTRSDCIHYLWRLYRCTCPLYTLYTCTLSLSPQLVHWPGAGTRTLPGMTSHCNQGQTSLKYFLQSNPHKYLVHNQGLLLGWWSMVLTC